ncbi:MAG: polyheme membrane-associated cytochrome C [Deltaproteobacteria bacterium]|nr:polyheme membrane-associated cytochrome C [Candidatus Anaeroferrophillacea bacterium]
MGRKGLCAALLIMVGCLVQVAAGFAEEMYPYDLEPIINRWISSGHADGASESFTHWDAEGEVPAGCAACHSSPGYLDFLGYDGTKSGQVDKPAPLGTVVNCLTCHNEAAAWLDEVTFPSGKTVGDLGPEARCMVCHQGRESGLDVDADIAAANVAGDDEVSADLGFINIHYYATGATLYGGQAIGGYQYAGRSYDLKFDHVEGYDTCIGCHDPYSLEVRTNESVRPSECADCHARVSTVADLQNIRMNGSMVDYDGDGDLREGIAGEIATLQEKLYQSIQSYGATVTGNPVIYDSHT